MQVFWIASQADQDLAKEHGYQGEAAPFEREGEWVDCGAHAETVDAFIEGVWPGTYAFVFEDGNVWKLTVHHVTNEELLISERMMLA